MLAKVERFLLNCSRKKLGSLLPDFSRDLRKRRMVLEGHPRTIVSLFSISRSLVS